MLTTRELIKTLYNALIQKFKSYRGNWEQNNPAANDYIKNRPFYTLAKQEVEILSETSVNSDSDARLNKTLIVGQTYNVYCDGNLYECVGKEYDGYIMLGNNAIYPYDNGIETDTGEPFALEAQMDAKNCWFYFNDDNEHTVSITTTDELVKTIDKKYIPDLGLAPVAYSNNYWDLDDLPEVYSDVVRYNYTQSLSTKQKQRARTNIGAVSLDDITGVVKYTDQTLTDEQKEQARTNIGAAGLFEVDTELSETSENTVQNKVVAEKFQSLKAGIILTDEVNGYDYFVKMRNGKLTSRCSISSIEVTTMPNKLDYIAGEYFDPTGMVVTATCQDGSSLEITNYTSTSIIMPNTTEVIISYIEGNIYTVTIPINVTEFDAATVLVDFTYTTNNDGTYTITGWNKTLNGESSTEMIVPNNGLIQL